MIVAETIRKGRADCPTRAGFTLVELLVVIAIIGVLVSLLLPAVQAAREAARRTQCSNNLRQLGIAMHNHHDVKGHLPPGHYGPVVGTSCANGSEATWVAYLLPFIEQQNIYDTIDWNLAFGCTANKQVTNQPIAAMRCPSDNQRGPASPTHDGPFARGNYAANNGIGPMREWDYLQGFAAHPPQAREGGVFFINSNMRLSEILDGTSQTVMISEVRTHRNVNDFRGVMYYPEGPLYHHNHTPNTRIPDQWRSNLCFNDDFRIPCIGTFTAWNNRSMVQSARSYHPGGVHTTLADASVRFVAETIDFNIWQALSTPRAPAGEVIVGSF